MIGRIPILDVDPLVECGRWPAKAVVGESVMVSATVFRDGHDVVGANVVLRDPAGRPGPFTRMVLIAPGTDRWEAPVTPTCAGRWTFQIEAWSDPLATWRHDAQIKVGAGQDVELVLEEGARLHDRAARLVPPDLRPLVRSVSRVLRDASRPADERLAVALDPHVIATTDDHPVRELVTKGAIAALMVERERALVGSWYEFFPRSEGAVADPVSGHVRPGTLRTALERLPAVAAMGFDVVYLPPVHPIGRSFRKGPNNAVESGPSDPGSPWAIGGPEGGHDAIHPELGTLEDFDAFVAGAAELGLEVALDLALQCSPDHPWLAEHPEWFTTRSDGSIKYAENPPKRYQDIYPLNFDNDPEGLTAEVLRIVRHWVAHGIRIFRVDNPHTKPIRFWESLIAEIWRSDPDVVWLAEAFSRPPMMHALAKVGFSQSYTYFTWRNEKWELEAYLRDLAGPHAAFMRPNFFVNTPDILHAYLQSGGPPAFKIRATLAALLSPTWGVYAGFELFEHVAAEPGSEEYLDSEKYQYRPRDWAGADREQRTLAPYLTRLNELRGRHPALRRLRNLRFHAVDTPELICWSKRLPGAAAEDDIVLVVVNLDPHSAREGTLSLDLPALGAAWSEQLEVTDELTGATYHWGSRSYVRLDPSVEPAHIFSVRRLPQ
ncbi:MAG TPA: alpha-1,4-glucan--maltose-1-phosphate maltosyltransferase [Mycobacteriales bacterium]|nr:alpha-1,4-glucan--maltose-1-phosphate maltosyltransferase [Mycobacteriales bacterium]